MKLLVFTRYPLAGCVKTRLIPALGAAGAERVHRQMAEHTVNRLRGVPGMEICYTGGDEGLMRDWLGQALSYSNQGEGDLGIRLQRAFSYAFLNGEDRVVVVGSDCPGLTTSHVEEAFRLLKQHDLVLGPATDGGYYLLGLRQFYNGIFTDIPWGTHQVLQETIKKRNILGLKTALLERLSDVDRPEDLVVWEALQNI